MSAAISVSSGFAPDVASRQGIAWFSSENGTIKNPHAMPILASVGGLPPQRYEHWQALPAHIVWWTNLSKAESWSLGHWDRWKDSQWWGQDLIAWMVEWGHPLDMTKASHEVLAGWSEVTSRAALSLMGFASEQGKEWQWGDGSVAEALAAQIPSGASSFDGPAEVFRSALIDKVKVSFNGQDWSKLRRLPLLRHEPSLSLQRLQAPVPHGPWEEVSSSLLGQGEDRWHWLRKQRVPTLVCINNFAWATEHRSLADVWLGQRGFVFTGLPLDPLWMTREEALLAKSFGYAEISHAYQCPEWRTPDASQFSPGFPSSDFPLRHDSLAQRMIGEAWWRAGSSAWRHPFHRKEHGADAQAVWRRSLERQSLWPAVVALHQLGLQVLEYGDGAVWIGVQEAWNKEQWLEVFQVARQHSLQLPLPALQSLPLPADASIDNPWDRLCWIKQVGGWNAMLELDRLAMPWWGPEVKNVLAVAVQNLTELPTPNSEWKDKWKKMLRHQATASVNDLRKNQGKLQ